MVAVPADDKGKTCVIGLHYVVEDVRHSGIGSALLREVIEGTPAKNIVTHLSKTMKNSRTFYQCCISTRRSANLAGSC